MAEKKRVAKIAITGKGGVGKTTLAGLLAYIFAAQGENVIAIDADPDANLASALGFPPELVEQITPIAAMDDLIYERTGAQRGTTGGFFQINPRVDDIPDRFSAVHRGIRLLVLGTVKKGGAGCICPESALLRSLMVNLLLHRNEVVIADMEAGIEHLGRATAQAVDAMIVVVEPGRRSLQTAETIRRLAGDLGLARVFVVGNKVRNDEDRRFIAENLPDFKVLGYLPFSADAIRSDLEGKAVYDIAPGLVAEAEKIAAALRGNGK
ncbi:MAG: AAA family ATPase [Chloroflexi bacterium]|nr:AAA family ATPase [Chloroflexota bacterium]